MGTNAHAVPKDAVRAEGEDEDALLDVVLGLHWDPQEQRVTAGKDLANLDALCVLLDADSRAVEIVHPGRPRNANGSVVHTGDSPTGAGTWDDERIFVFLDALPESVSALVFIVASANGHGFGGVSGATCHVSDRMTEREWIRLDLTSLGSCRTHCVATLRRSPTGWTVSPGARAVDGDIAVLGQEYPWSFEGRKTSMSTTKGSES